MVSTCRADRLPALHRDACHPDLLAWRTSEELAGLLAARLGEVFSGQGKVAGGEVEGVLLDTLTAAVKKLIARGRERGYVTYDELNAALPADQVSSEMIEDTMAMLREIGISVVESDEDGDPTLDGR